MNNKIKYLFVLILVILFTVSGTVCAYAEEEHTNEEYTNVEYKDGEYISEESEDNTNFFEKVYTEVVQYASEILCALTFTGSLTLAFAYKKGLLPLVEKSLVTIGNAVTKIKENTKESTEINSKLGSNIESSLQDTQELIIRLSERIGSLEKALNGSLENESEARLESKQLRVVVDAQIDMLYDIFMCSALPQYQKDAIGERIAIMKGAIRENAHTE